MAGRGPAPKSPEERRRRNAAPDLHVVHSDGKPCGPTLPPDIDWPDATLAWWETWRTSAQAKTFTETDWSFLLDTALLHMDFWDGDRSVASELRLRAAKFGATPEDRARLKLEVGKTQQPPAATKKPAKKAARRTRVLQVVEDAKEA